MPVEITSRYRPLGVIEAPGTDGLLRPTVPIRRKERLPAPAVPLTYSHRVIGAEDIEYVAWRFYGRSEAWWRIADANAVAFPLDVRAGDALQIPSSEGVGLVPSRERTF